MKTFIEILKSDLPVAFPEISQFSQKELHSYKPNFMNAVPYVSPKNLIPFVLKYESKEYNMVLAQAIVKTIKENTVETKAQSTSNQCAELYLFELSPEVNKFLKQLYKNDVKYRAEVEFMNFIDKSSDKLYDLRNHEFYSSVTQNIRVLLLQHSKDENLHSNISGFRKFAETIVLFLKLNQLNKDKMVEFLQNYEVSELQIEKMISENKEQWFERSIYTTALKILQRQESDKAGNIINHINNEASKDFLMADNSRFEILTPLFGFILKKMP